MIATTTACLISMLFCVVLRRLKEGGKLALLEWDIATVTAGDYTVRFDIEREAYDHWNTKVYKKRGG